MQTQNTQPLTIAQIREKYQNLLITHRKTIQEPSEVDFNNPAIRRLHESIVLEIGNNYCRKENRNFEIDNNNIDILRFLLYYFNGYSGALTLFPDRHYALHKNILLIGPPGTGKTLIMQIFADYLKMTGNPHQYKNLSTTQMTNYYKLHGNIDRYTYNQANNNGFDGSPINLCLNDIGIDLSKHKSYGTDIQSVIDEFLFARYEIFQLQHKRTHLTSNLAPEDFREKYEARLLDRFKNYNILCLPGTTRRR